MVRKINYRKPDIIKVLSLMAVGCLLSISAVNAQEGPESIGEGLDGENTPVPFDGGVSALVAASIVYGGVKKAYDQRKNATSNDAEATTGTSL